MKVSISNFLDITKSVILADLLWTDLTLLIAKRIFCRMGGPRFIWMSHASSVYLIFSIRLCFRWNIYKKNYFTFLLDNDKRYVVN